MPRSTPTPLRHLTHAGVCGRDVGKLGIRETECGDGMSKSWRSDYTQDRVYLSPPDVGEPERNLLLDAFDSNWIAPLGPHVDAFELEIARRIGVGHGAALSSGTAALHLALLLLGVGTGDEVITSTLTFAATANAIKYVGAAPVYVDVDADTWQLSPDLVAEELEHCSRRGKIPKAMIAVDLYGQCADYDRLNEICGRYDVMIIEDAAEALGATYRDRAAGALGALGVFSFNGNKIITTGGGGMLVSNRRDWIERARFLASQAREPARHYQHSQIGYNYRLSNLLAAVGRAQLEGLDRRIEQRRRHRAAYREALGGYPGIRFMPEATYGSSNAWLTCMTVESSASGCDVGALLDALEAQNIEARPIWKPLHLQPAFADCRVRGGEVATRLFNTGMCLPSGSKMSGQERARVVRTIEGVLNDV